MQLLLPCRRFQASRHNGLHSDSVPSQLDIDENEVKANNVVNSLQNFHTCPKARDGRQ